MAEHEKTMMHKMVDAVGELTPTQWEASNPDPAAKPDVELTPAAIYGLTDTGDRGTGEQKTYIAPSTQTEKIRVGLENAWATTKAWAPRVGLATGVALLAGAAAGAFFATAEPQDDIAADTVEPATFEIK